MRYLIAALIFLTVVPISSQWCMCSGVCFRYLTCPFGCVRSGPFCSIATRYHHDCELLQSKCNSGLTNCVSANITSIAHNTIQIRCPAGTNEMKTDTYTLGSGNEIERIAKCFTSGMDQIWMVRFDEKWIPINNIYCVKP